MNQENNTNNKRITDSTPATDGYYMPAEFTPHDGTILIWPVRPGSWPYGGKEAQNTVITMAGVLSAGEKVYLCADESHMVEMEAAVSYAFASNFASILDVVKNTMTQNAQESCGQHEQDPEGKHTEYETLREALMDAKIENIKFLQIPTNDSWARDIGPTFVKSALGDVRGVNWKFNAWGGDYNGLYEDYDLDDAFAAAFCEKTGYDLYDAGDFVLEGGSIHVDGEGTVVVTEACLLSEGRNPQLSREEIEDTLKEYLGAEKVIWLPCGIYNDETDEHVDNVFAFTAPGEAVLAISNDEIAERMSFDSSKLDSSQAEDENSTFDPQTAMSLADLDVLSHETDAKGRTIKVRTIKVPKVHVTITQEEMDGLQADEGEDEREVGERLAASYVNFYIGNQAVLVPQFGDVNDRAAIDTLRECFPDRKVVGIPARSIIVGGGNFHCITQQIPAGVSK